MSDRRIKALFIGSLILSISFGIALVLKGVWMGLNQQTIPEIEIVCGTLIIAIAGFTLARFVYGQRR